MSEWMVETPLMRGLECVLNQTAFRHRILSTNIANVDTPGYHSRDIRKFSSEIERAMTTSMGEDLDDSGMDALAAMMPVAAPVRGLMERPDGNNVSVERESLLLAENQLEFQVATAFLKSEFHTLSTAINSGSSS